MDSEGSRSDRLSLLREARDLLAVAMNHRGVCPACETPLDLPAPTLPAVVRELRAVLAEIDAIPGSGEVTPLDELAGGIADDLEAQRKKRKGRASTA